MLSLTALGDETMEVAQTRAGLDNRVFELLPDTAGKRVFVASESAFRVINLK